MVTNEARAADILAEAGAYCGQCCFGECGEPDCPRDADWRGCPDCAAVVNGYARALAAAGLLAPDLPPVIVDDFDERPHVTITHLPTTSEEEPMSDQTTPALPTLADMTPTEREACRWMHAEVKVADLTPEERPECRWAHADLKGVSRHVVILSHHEEDGSVRVLWPCGCDKPVAWEKVTPRPDWVPMEWPDTEKPAPAPAAAVEVGDVIESADDPRIAALPTGSVLEDRVYGGFHDVTKTATGEWVGLGYKPHAGMGTRWGPWTVRRIGQRDDQ